VETVCGPHHTLEQVVTVNSDDGQNDNHISHTRSNLDSCVKVKCYEMEKIGGGAVAHPVPDVADVGLQVGNPVAGHVVGMIASEMVQVHISEWVLGRITKPGTEIVDPETPV